MSDTVDLATKGEAVEEWFDLHFFRPIGARIARAAYPRRVSPDQLTLVGLIIGLIAGHLFMYTSPALNAAGFVLFIISDIFDSADGQLARLRGTSTRFGRIVDGFADSLRFVNMYASLGVRLILAGWFGPGALGLALAALLSHSTQSTAVDFIRHAFLAIGEGPEGGSELGDGALAAPGAARRQSWIQRMAIVAYHGYTARQRWMFPQTWELVTAAERGDVSAAASAAYRQRAGRLLPVCAWLGQNIRWALVGIAGVSGAPAAMLWVTLIPMNLLMLGLIFAQERVAVRVAGSGITAAPPPEPASIA